MSMSDEARKEFEELRKKYSDEADEIIAREKREGKRGRDNEEMSRHDKEFAKAIEAFKKKHGIKNQY